MLSPTNTNTPMLNESTHNPIQIPLAQPNSLYLFVCSSRHLALFGKNGIILCSLSFRISIHATPLLFPCRMKVIHCHAVMRLESSETKSVLLSSAATLKFSFLSHSWCVSDDGADRFSPNKHRFVLGDTCPFLQFEKDDRSTETLLKC